MTENKKILKRIHRFIEHEMRILESNPNVIHVSDKSITYARAFKLAAVKAYREGKTPQEIYVEAGFNLNIINPKNLSDCLKRWRTAYASHGELLEDRRGKGSTGHKPKVELSTDEQLKRALARVKLLEVENKFLKKLEELEGKVRTD
jgi:transposase